jgi:hypothetical protein
MWVVCGFAMLILAGMNGLLASSNTIAPRDQLRQVTGQLQELVLQDARAGAFTITLASEGALHTFEFKNAHRLVTLLSPRENLDGRQINPAVTVALTYFPDGLGKTVVDVTLGQDNVLSYEDVASLAAKNVARDRNTAMGLGAFGALLIFLGGAAWIARVGLEEAAAPVTNGSEVLLILLIMFGLNLVVILAEPATLHRRFGDEAFHLPIEYVVSTALALLFFLPLWLSYMGLSALAHKAMRDGGVGKAGWIILNISPLWFFFIYPISFWLIFAVMFGPSAP